MAHADTAITTMPGSALRSDASTGSTVSVAAKSTGKTGLLPAAEWTESEGRAVAVEMRPRHRRMAMDARLDPVLLARAADLLEDIERLNTEEMSLALESLRCVICELWISAEQSSQYHCSILTIVETFIQGRDAVDLNQGTALRGAIRDLSSTHLTEQYVDVIRSQFIDQGYNPLAPLSGLETNSHDAGD